MLRTADDEALVELISQASRRLIVIAPALTNPVAAAVIARWRLLGGDAVKITLDVNPEVYRLGYGDAAALVALERAGRDLGSILQRHDGIRIGVVIADDVVLAWAPVPALVEAGPRDSNAPNAVLIGKPSEALLAAVGASKEGTATQEIGLDKAELVEIEAVQENLKADPPQKFDVARRVRVFNAAFQFVELRMPGTSIGRKTISIPPQLMGAVDAAMEGRLKTLLNVVPKGHELSGKTLQDERRLLDDEYLAIIPGYGHVVLREQKSVFQAAVESLSKKVDRFKAHVEAELESELSKRVDELFTMLLPRLKEKPPESWLMFVDPSERDTQIERRLRADLKKAVGTAARYVGEMKISLVLRDVTFESLNDQAFVGAARKVFPDLKALHVEFDAARAAS
jgi:hypothetical protein